MTTNPTTEAPRFCSHCKTKPLRKHNTSGVCSKCSTKPKERRPCARCHEPNRLLSTNKSGVCSDCQHRGYTATQAERRRVLFARRHALAFPLEAASLDARQEKAPGGGWAEFRDAAISATADQVSAIDRELAAMVPGFDAEPPPEQLSIGAKP